MGLRLGRRPLETYGRWGGHGETEERRKGEGRETEEREREREGDGRKERERSEIHILTRSMRTQQSTRCMFEPKSALC